MIRLGVLSAFVVLVGMVRSRMTHRDAWIIFGVGVGLAATGAVLFAVGSRRLTERMSLDYRAAGILLLLRRTGLPLLGLAFFLVWTIVYVGLWAFDPVHSFAGLAPLPRFAAFCDITDVFETKLESIRRYETMLRPVPHIRSLEAVEGLATIRGAEIGVRYAEAFGVLRSTLG